MQKMSEKEAMSESEAIIYMKTIKDAMCDSLTQQQANKAIDIAISALEKQIPKSPNIIKGNYSYTYTCPYCDLHIISRHAHGWFVGRKSTFCQDCGQRLDWRGCHGEK